MEKVFKGSRVRAETVNCLSCSFRSVLSSVASSGGGRLGRAGVFSVSSQELSRTARKGTAGRMFQVELGAVNAKSGKVRVRVNGGTVFYCDDRKVSFVCRTEFCADAATFGVVFLSGQDGGVLDKIEYCSAGSSDFEKRISTAAKIGSNCLFFVGGWVACKNTETGEIAFRDAPGQVLLGSAHVSSPCIRVLGGDVRARIVKADGESVSVSIGEINKFTNALPFVVSAGFSVYSAMWYCFKQPKISVSVRCMGGAAYLLQSEVSSLPWRYVSPKGITEVICACFTVIEEQRLRFFYSPSEITFCIPKTVEQELCVVDISGGTAASRIGTFTSKNDSDVVFDIVECAPEKLKVLCVRNSSTVKKTLSIPQAALSGFLTATVFDAADATEIVWYAPYSAYFTEELIYSQDSSRCFKSVRCLRVKPSEFSVCFSTYPVSASVCVVSPTYLTEFVSYTPARVSLDGSENLEGVLYVGNAFCVKGAFKATYTKISLPAVSNIETEIYTVSAGKFPKTLCLYTKISEIEILEFPQILSHKYVPKVCLKWYCGQLCLPYFCLSCIMEELPKPRGSDASIMASCCILGEKVVPCAMVEVSAGSFVGVGRGGKYCVIDDGSTEEGVAAVLCLSQNEKIRVPCVCGGVYHVIIENCIATGAPCIERSHSWYSAAAPVFEIVCGESGKVYPVPASCGRVENRVPLIYYTKF